MQATTPAKQEKYTIYQAPANSGQVALGRNLVELLDDACANNPNPKAFNQPTPQGYKSMSTTEFAQRAEQLAMGLVNLGLKRGDCVAFYTHSDVSFCLGDMACLIAGMVSVPIYLTHSEAAIRHILTETEAKAIFVSDEPLLKEIHPLLLESSVQTVILWQQSSITPDDKLKSFTYSELERRGETELQADPEAISNLKQKIDAQDLATIIYTSGTTGMPKGVMLSHENISSNVIAAITGLDSFTRGVEETAISFLPLTHIFARTLHYCLMWYGTAVYFSDPDKLRDDLKVVNPTFFAAVPRVLEKAYERILATGASLTGFKRKLFDWSLDLAKRYNVESPPTGFEAVQLKLANVLVFSKWREALGGKVRMIIVGGAAMRADLVNIFAAAGINIIQGYGLTETSPVIAYNRPHMNKPGTVGLPLAGVEVALTDQKEIIARGPLVMQGYYKSPEKTAEVIDKDGWFHTGDMGEFTEDGYLKITGRIKNLFKLSTGKYVMPQPLEEALESDPIIDTALVTGEGEKFCTALLFTNREALSGSGVVSGDITAESLKSDTVKELFRNKVAQANKAVPHWSNIKRFALILGELTIEGGMLTPKMSVKRHKVLEAYQPFIEVLYDHAERKLDSGVIVEV
jgi:long-chain acyl-CoA synthetase